MTPVEPVSRRTQFIDCEMLCWPNKQIPSGQSNHIIQIGIVEVDADNFDITRKHRYYVRPKNKNFEVSEYCTILTGITKETILDEGKYFPEIMRTIKKEFSQRGNMYAWGTDSEVIQHHCNIYTIKNPWEARGILNFSAFFHDSFCLKKKLKLIDALNHLNLSFEGSQHCALNDAFNLARLYIATSKQLTKGYTRT